MRTERGPQDCLVHPSYFTGVEVETLEGGSELTEAVQQGCVHLRTGLRVQSVLSFMPAALSFPTYKRKWMI